MTDKSVSEGDTIILTAGEGQTEATVSKRYEDGSFIIEYEQNGETTGQIFRPSVFRRSPHIEHEPKEEAKA